MADLATSDVAVTLNPQNVDFMTHNKVTMPAIAFGDGALTYPAGGIPMPDLAHFGLNKEIKRVDIEQPANGYVYHFDRTNHKLRIFQGGAVAAGAIAAASAGTPAGSVAAPTFTGTPISPGTPAGTVDPDTHAFTGAAMGNITPAGSNSAPAFTGSALPTHKHTLTGGGASAAPLAELGHVAVAATILNLTVIGQ